MRAPASRPRAAWRSVPINGESVVTSITSTGYGGTCTGACLDVSQYVWASSPAGLLNVEATQDGGGKYTTALYNTNGLPIQVTYGDNDSNPSNTPPSASRTVWMFYDSTYPGRLAEVRRKSDLAVPATACDNGTNTGGCARSIYSYNADTTLHTVVQTGTTLSSAGGATAYTYTTTYAHDTNGRVTEVDGPVSGAKTTYAYWSSSDPFKDQFLQTTSVYTDATHHLDSSLNVYDFWGNATTEAAPDGTMTCRTFSSTRGYLTQLREAMAGQSDCSSSNGANLTTSWTRDSALRITQLTRPDGSCVFDSYDSSGRLYQVKRRDDCSPSSSGDTQQLVYTADGQISEVDTYNAAGTLTRKQPYTYYNSRKLQNVVNPVNTSVATTVFYTGSGFVNEVDGPSGLGKTTYAYNDDNRITSETRYNTTTATDTWTLLYDWLGDQSSVTDGDSKTTQSVRDDLGRIVKLTSVDMSYPTVRVYDAAGRLTTLVEAQGGGSSQQTHTFTRDYTGRSLATDYQGYCYTWGTPHPEIQRTYDALPGGVTCPMGGGCNHLQGRLAYVETTLLCSTTYGATDGALDQFTFYSYDADGRLVEEYITDDSGRTADHQYEWTKDGALSKVTTPSGAVIGWTYGSGGSNSDTDQVATIWRTTTGTPIAESVNWFPFGPLMSYKHENTVSSVKLQTRITRNLAYRISDIRTETTTGVEKYGVAITEDAKGRVTARDYADNGYGVQDSYFQYDGQDRVLCETTTYQTSCPSSGTTTKVSHYMTPPFTHAGDWTTVFRGSWDVFALNSGAHQIAQVHRAGSQMGRTNYTYNALGNRTSEYPAYAHWDTHYIERDYTYDTRHNVTNIRGRYYASGPWHYYDVASAFDAKNRRVFKSFYDESTGQTSTWYFYYDPLDRLTEIRYTPNLASPSTYSLYQLFWLHGRMVLYWQTDYPSATTSKRYTGTDETGRILDMWSWPSSGDATRVWGQNPQAWGQDTNVISWIFQPLLFAGQYQDAETFTLDDYTMPDKPPLAVDQLRTYDPFTGSYLQHDPILVPHWSPYVYNNTNTNTGSSSEPVDSFVGNPADKLPHGAQQQDYYDVFIDGYICSIPNRTTSGGVEGAPGGGLLTSTDGAFQIPSTPISLIANGQSSYDRWQSASPNSVPSGSPLPPPYLCVSHVFYVPTVVCTSGCDAEFNCSSFLLFDRLTNSYHPPDVFGFKVVCNSHCDDTLCSGSALPPNGLGGACTVKTPENCGHPPA